jgi:hypothetical protein
MPDTLPDRLEMLLVAEWLEAGTPEDGTVSFHIAHAAEELGIAGDRAGILQVMGALSALEDARRIEIRWGARSGAPALVHLADVLQRDARRALEPPA